MYATPSAREIGSRGLRRFGSPKSARRSRSMSHGRMFGWGCSAFVAYHHAILRAANAVPQLRQRLTETGDAVEWAQVDATPTVLRSDDSFAVARLVYAERLRDFAAPAQAAIDAALAPAAVTDVELTYMQARQA